jgi:hypothetical protein
MEVVMEKQTNINLSEEERQLCRLASGTPYDRASIVKGVRALLADWVRRGQPELAPEAAAEPAAE